MFPHNLLTHNLITTKLAHHTTCLHTSCSHTTYSPHNLLTTQLAHHTTCSPHSLLAHNLLTHNLLTHNMFTHTTCSHTHNMFTHNLLTHNMFTHTVSDTQLTHTQLTHTQLAHTQLTHTHNLLTVITHNMFTHNCWHRTYSHTQLAHTHSLLTTQLAHHTTCSHTTCSHTTHHTTCSPHSLLAHNLLTHNLLTHNLLTHNLLTHNLSTRILLTQWQAWRLRHWAGSGGALESELTPWVPRPFAWQAWHLATWTVTLPGKCGTWRHGPSLCLAGVGLTALGFLWWRAWVWVDAVGAVAVCVAGVALGDMDRHFAWQAWHLATWTCTLRGRRGTWGHASSLFVASVALGDMDRYFAWQVWHLWHWAGSGGALGSELTPWAPRPFTWQAWHLATWTVTLPGRRGTWRHGRALRVAGVALTALGWLWWRPFHCCTRRSFTIFFLFPAFPIPSFYLSFAAYWKKLTCGVIRSCNCCFCCSSLRAIDTGGKRLITTYVTYDYISPRFPVLFLSLVAGCIWLFRLVDLRHISLDKISGI